MGAVIYATSQIGLLILVGLLLTGVLWEANHLVEWAQELCRAHGDGSLASYLRHHAYTYVSWFFGTDFGWTLGE